MYFKASLFITIITVFILNNFISFVNCGGGHVNNEELYKLLGVSKTASTKQIRVAFKNLALVKHPDKNKDDPNANEEFIKINRAYEILKDEELRKKYDLYGEDGLKDNHQSGQNYQSWNFYHQNFGIYDDDPEIVTLSRTDFMQSVESNSDTIWFVNFYSTQCSHCHELAPTWRDLAKQLDGVVKIGAVNCMDDWMLCNQQQIQSFPSLIMYPKRERYHDAKTIDKLIRFALSFASGSVQKFTSIEHYKKELQKSKSEKEPWLISFCLTNDYQGISNVQEDHENEELNYEVNCLEDSILKKLAIMLNGLVKVANVKCGSNQNDELCLNYLKPQKSAPLVYYNVLPDLDHSESSAILSSDYKLIVELCLDSLPDVKKLNADEFNNILVKLRDNNKEIDLKNVEKPWLFQFINTKDQSNNQLEFKRLPKLLGTEFNYAQVDCQDLLNTENECLQKFKIHQNPTFALFKSLRLINGGQIMLSSSEDNWYELYYSTRQSPQDLSKFVKDNAFTAVRTLTKFDLSTAHYELTLNDKLAFIVDFFAPWCPPCMSLLPEFRKSSKLDASKSVLFGTIDCTVNSDICERFNVRSYPTTILFNNSIPNNFHGQHSAEDIADFIQDVLKPSVVKLNYDSFHSMVGSKPKGIVWLVDFFASWCGPCQQLAPEWRKLAKKMDRKVVSVGQVDCVEEQRLCAEQGIQSYPNIRVYLAEAIGYSRFEQYQGWMRDVHSLFQWASNYLPSKAHKLDMNNFEELVLRNSAHDENEDEDQPWLVDFYAPWCGHCQVFAPTFELLAEKLEGRVKLGKVNCQVEQYLCQMANIRAFPTIRFYPTATLHTLNWDYGDDIQSYEFNSIMNIVNAKLKNYENKTKNNAKKAEKSEL